MARKKKKNWFGIVVGACSVLGLAIGIIAWRYPKEIDPAPTKTEIYASAKKGIFEVPQSW